MGNVLGEAVKQRLRYQLDFDAFFRDVMLDMKSFEAYYETNGPVLRQLLVDQIIRLEKRIADQQREIDMLKKKTVTIKMEISTGEKQ